MKIRMMIAALLLLVSFPLFARRVTAQTAASHQKLITCHVSLVVEHAVPPTTTLWLAYGPPAGTFGIVRLNHTTGSVYAASLQLPSGSRARFSYLAGHGTIRTPEGTVPGNPVVTIREFAPTSISPRPLPTVRWSGLTG